MVEAEMLVFTDGSCYANHPDKLGGSGVYIVWGTEEHFIQKGYRNTTVYRREVEAILLALRAIKKNWKVKASFYIDSESAANVFRTKFLEWSQGKFQGESMDLWNQVFEEISLHPLLRIKVTHIESHRKIDPNDFTTIGNAIADMLADYKNQTYYELDLPKESLVSKEWGYFYHENSDLIFVSEKDTDFGLETGFTHYIGRCKKSTKEELIQVCRANSFDWLVNCMESDTIEIDKNIK